MDIALLGNPNTGKTSLFNHLTGSYEYVGNWSGVTVEKKVGVFKNSSDILIDLPGIYTLSPLSKDEGVVTNFFLHDTCDQVLNILDASQLRRNLHLTIQLLEYGKPVVIGLNMMDVAKQRGIHIDVDKLASILEVPVVPVVARSGIGCDKLAGKMITINERNSKNNLIDYGNLIEESINQMEGILTGKVNHSIRWLILQTLEGNQYVKTYLLDYLDGEKLDGFIHDIRGKGKKRIWCKISGTVYL